MLSVVEPFDGMTLAESTQLCLDAINNGARITISIVCSDENDNEIIVNDDDLLMGNAFSSHTVFNPDEDLQYGSVNSAQTTIRLIKNSKTVQIDWSKKVEVYFDVPTSAGTGTVLYGQYYGEDPSKVTQMGVEVYEYIGYDVISTLDIPADDFLSGITFPIGITYFVHALEEYLGITINYGTAMFDLIIPSNIFNNGCTFRELMHWIAEPNGWSVTAQGKDIYMKSFPPSPVSNPNAYTITPNQYYTINKSEHEVPTVPAVVYESTVDPSKTTSYPSTYTGVPYIITDNPIIESMDSAEILQRVRMLYLAKLTFGTGNRYKYIPASVNAIGNPFVQAGDIILVEDLYGVTDPLMVFTHTFTYGAGARSSYESTGSVKRRSQSYGVMSVSQVNEIIGRRTVNNIATTKKGCVIDSSALATTNYDPVTGSFSGNKNTSKYYRVVGNGMVFIQAYTRASSSDDTGTITTTIYESDENKQNGAILSIGCSRLSSTATTRVTSNASLARYMTDGQRIRVYHACTKNGTNNWQHIMTTMGCQLEEY